MTATAVTVKAAMKALFVLFLSAAVVICCYHIAEMITW